MKKLLKLIVAIVLVAVLSVAFVACANSPKGVLKRYFKGYNELDIEKMAEAFASKDSDAYNKAKKRLEEEIEALKGDSEFSIIKKIDKFTIKEETHTTATAEVALIVIIEYVIEEDILKTKVKNTEEKTAVIKFVKVDGNWYLDIDEFDMDMGF